MSERKEATPRRISRIVGLTMGLLLIPTLAFSTEEAKLPVPPTGWDQLKSVPHGELKKNVSYQTRNFGSQVYSIHLPPGYSTAKKYPVLYLHHGITDDQLTWTNQTKGRAHNILDNLYAEGKATPMIVVMVDGAMGAQSDFNAFGKFEDVLLKDLIPHIEATYSASTDPAERAIAGLSMGGGQTLNFGFKNYTVFSWIGAFNSAPNTTPAGTTIKDPAAVKARIRFTFLSCGSKDDLLDFTKNYHTFLDANKIEPHMYQLEPNEKHSWTSFNRALYNFVQRIFPVGRTAVDAHVLDGKREASRATLVLQSGRVTVQGFDLGALFALDGKRRTFSAPPPLMSGR